MKPKGIIFKYINEDKEGVEYNELTKIILEVNPTSKRNSKQ